MSLSLILGLSELDLRCPIEPSPMRKRSGMWAEFVFPRGGIVHEQPAGCDREKEAPPVQEAGPDAGADAAVERGGDSEVQVPSGTSNVVSNQLAANENCFFSSSNNKIENWYQTSLLKFWSIIRTREKNNSRSLPPGLTLCIRNKIRKHINSFIGVYWPTKLLSRRSAVSKPSVSPHS